MTCNKFDNLTFILMIHVLKQHGSMNVCFGYNK
jgi:hypothetical protein